MAENIRSRHGRSHAVMTVISRIKADGHMSPALLMLHRKYARSLKRSVQLHKALDQAESTVGAAPSYAHYEHYSETLSRISKIDMTDKKLGLLEDLLRELFKFSDNEHKVFQEQIAHRTDELAQHANNLFTTGRDKILAAIEALQKDTGMEEPITDELIDALVHDAGDGLQDIQTANEWLQSTQISLDQSTAASATSMPLKVDHPSFREALIEQMTKYWELSHEWNLIKYQVVVMKSKSFAVLNKIFQDFEQAMRNQLHTSTMITDEKMHDTMSQLLERMATGLSHLKSEVTTASTTHSSAAASSVTATISKPNSGSAASPALPSLHPQRATAPLTAFSTTSEHNPDPLSADSERDDFLRRIDEVSRGFAVGQKTRVPRLRAAITKHKNKNGSLASSLASLAAVIQHINDGATSIGEFIAHNNKPEPNIYILRAAVRFAENTLGKMNEDFVMAYAALGQPET